jgi:hypothetical protein
VSPAPPDTDRPLLGATIAFVIAVAVALFSCGPHHGAVLAPPDSVPLPTWCVVAVTTTGVRDVYCSESRERCEMAADWASWLRRRLAISAPSRCFDRAAVRPSIHEQKTEIR